MPGDDERLWAELVETFHASPDDEKRRWPEAEDVEPDGDDGSTAGRAPAEPEATTTPLSPPPDPAGARRPEADDHYVPPPPPPFPRTDAITVLAWVGVIGTPVFLTASVLLGRSVSGWLAALAAGAFIGGFAILVTRLRGHDPYDPDDGAVV